MNVAIPKYSPEYLDSVQERFPEFQNHTKSQLVTALDNNEHREPGVYEYQVESALHEIEQEVILDGDDQLLGYLFGDMDQAHSEKIQNGINYVIQNWWRGDLVLGSRMKERSQWRDTTVWAPAFPENFNFILSSKDQDYLKPGAENKILLILWVNQTGESDSLWRKKYKLAPKLVEIPAKTALVMKWMMFKKDLDAVRFQEHFEKIQA